MKDEGEAEEGGGEGFGQGEMVSRGSSVSRRAYQQRWCRGEVKSEGERKSGEVGEVSRIHLSRRS